MEIPEFKGPYIFALAGRKFRGNIPFMRQLTAGSICTKLIDQLDCVQKRGKQREALSTVFADISIKCSDSPALDLCYFSQEQAYGAEGSKERIRKVSPSPKTEIGSFKPEFATRFINKRDPIAEDLATHLIAYRSKIREAQDQGLVDKPQAKRLLLSNENLDAALVKVRAALAKNRIKVEYGSLSHPTCQCLPDPSGARITKQGLRKQHD